MTEEIRDCYRRLDLDPGASRDSVKDAYRELMKVWHPDRFPNDAKFQKKANDKAKELSGSRDKIFSYLSGSYTESRASAQAREAEEEVRRARGESSQRREREQEAREREEARVEADETRRAAEEASRSQNDSKPKVLWACEQCGKQFWAPYDAFGMFGDCPHCHQTTKIVAVAKAPEEPIETEEQNEEESIWTKDLFGAALKSLFGASGKSVWTRPLGNKRKKLTVRQHVGATLGALLGIIIVNLILFGIKGCHSQ